MGRSLRVRQESYARRNLVAAIPRNPKLNGLFDEERGYGILPNDLNDGLQRAIRFAQRVRAERHGLKPHKKKSNYNPTLIMAERYEDAPPFFDLALSDEILQIACDYLSEIPVLIRFKLWWTLVNEGMTGSQLYHRDGNLWLQRRAKFLINMNNVGKNCGPFTFLPANVSSRVSTAVQSMKERVLDDFVYRHASPSDAISLIGPAGTGVAIDTSRCYHYGARALGGERLILMFQFVRRADAVEGGQLRRSAAFHARFGDDPVRALVVPNHE